MVKQDLTLTDLYAFDLNNILVWIQLYIITKADDRNYSTEFKRNLAPDHNNTV